MTSKLAASAAIFLLTILFLPRHTNAQDNPVEHMNALSTLEENLSKKYLSYNSEVAHGERVRKMEKRREDLINTIKVALREGGKLRPYKGDVSLRNAYVSYWNVLLSLYNEEYHKLVDMEEVAEQSYDAMEAFLLIKEKVEERQEAAYEQVVTAYNAFAAAHGVRIAEGTSTKLSRKLSQTSQVNAYMNQMFLVYFKSSVQESNMIRAQNEKDVNGMEQSKNAMIQYAKVGLARLDTIRPYKGDGSLINAHRKMLEFLINEGETKMPAIISFMLKNEEFEKLKKSYDAKPEGKRTQADVDAFNSGVKSFNQAVELYNKTNTEMNNGRTKMIAAWTASRKRFLDLHVPH